MTIQKKISELPLALSGGLDSYMVIVNNNYSGSSGTETYKIPYSAVTNPNVNIGFFSQTGNSTVISGTTVETSLINGGVGTLSVPANMFKVGDSFAVTMGGIIQTHNNSQTIRIKVKSDTTILIDSGVQVLADTTGQEVFTLDIYFTIRDIGTTNVASILSLGSFTKYKTSNSNANGFAFNTTNSTTFSTEIDNSIDITVQWGDSFSDNVIFSDFFNLRKIY